jgi:tRNA (mo5U34)-methyltransferase
MTELNELQERVNSVVWFHSIDLGDGIVTDGFCKTFLEGSQLPDFTNKTVLDIGAWDGYYSFLAERRGASRVVAVDHYAWGVDFGRRNPYWVDCHEKGVLPDHSLDTTEFWDATLPGMRGFNIAREALGSKVETVVDDFSKMDLQQLGQFDVVLFLGVLYHLKEPLTALEQVRRATGGVAVIETEALLLPGHPRSLLEFTSGCYHGYDYSNWYTPTMEAILELCLAAGFSKINTVVGPPADPPPPPAGLARVKRGVRRRIGLSPAGSPPRALQPSHYRALVQAYP